MLKAVIVLLALSVFCRWALGRWPWDFLGGAASARPQGIERARILLGVSPEAGREEIIAAHRRLTAQVHPDKGGSNTAMQEANAARDLLLGQLPQAQDAGGEQDCSQ